MAVLRVLMDVESMTEIIANALHGWKKKRIRKAIEIMRRNWESAQAVQYHLPEECIVGPVSDAELVEVHGEDGGQVNGEDVEVVDDDYNGDLRHLINGLIRLDVVDADDKVKDVLKYLKKNKREEAHDTFVSIISKMKPEVTGSCKLSALLEMLDPAPPLSEHATDRSYAAGPRK